MQARGKGVRRAWASRLAWAAAICGTSSIAHIATAGELDATTGAMVPDPSALKVYHLDGPTELASYPLWSYRQNRGTGAVTVNKLDASTLPAGSWATGNAVLEGSGALRIGARVPGSPGGILLEDPSFFASIANRRVEVRWWGRAEGGATSLSVWYGKADGSAPSAEFATVWSTRTGRETSDGWLEYTTGDIDGSIWGVPIRAIAMSSVGSASGSSPDPISYVVDDIEVRALPGSLVSAVACTQDTVEAACGARGECLYGHCVLGAAAWGPLPPAKFRHELTERWITIATHLHGNRNVAALGTSTFAPAARNLALYSLGPRQYWGGLKALVNGLRDNHTSFGDPASTFRTMSPVTGFGWSGALNACFDVMEKDLIGGGQGLGVNAAGKTPAVGLPALKVGDVLTAIDGQDPIAWAQKWRLPMASAMNDDPAADLANIAEDISAMITSRASKVTITRCTSSTKCDGADKQTIDIDLASPQYAAILARTIDYPNYFGCGHRFRDAVSAIGADTPGEDTVTAETGTDGIVRVQFDGFTGNTQWPASMAAVFNPKPGKVLMDARLGNGGEATNVQALLDLLRGVESPVDQISLPRFGWDKPDDATMFDVWSSCFGGPGAGLGCLGAWNLTTSASDPPGKATKLAWLNTRDVSANDFMPKLLAGRAHLKIFSPHPTNGAFGAVAEMPTYSTGWGGARFPYQDSRFGVDDASARAARWESTHGVAPDVVVAQKMSDALDGKDTMLLAATAWLLSSAD